MRIVIFGILLFLVPAVVCLSSLLVKTTSTEKAIGLAVCRSFLSVLSCGQSVSCCGFGFAKVASMTHAELVAWTGRKTNAWWIGYRD